MAIRHLFLALTLIAGSAIADSLCCTGGADCDPHDANDIPTPGFLSTTFPNADEDDTHSVWDIDGEACQFGVWAYEDPSAKGLIGSKSCSVCEWVLKKGNEEIEACTSCGPCGTTGGFCLVSGEASGEAPLPDDDSIPAEK